MQRVHEESGAAAHFISQQRDACARVIEGLDHDVFQFLSQELLDSAFVFFLHFGVIGQQSGRSETVASRIRLFTEIY